MCPATRIASTVAIVLACATAFAQAPLSGTYSGSYIFPGIRGDTLLGVRFIVSDVDSNGTVNGKIELSSRGACAGDYPMRGKLEGNKLVMRSTQKGGRASDCSFSFNGVMDGNKIVGSTGATEGEGRPLQLAK
jgi:hypothetical protein